MIELVLASHNKKKVAELQSIFTSCLADDIRILSLSDIGFDGDIEENGSSFEENALIKAKVPASLGYIGIADDSGLCTNALDGAPGIYSARYAGDEASDAENRKKLLSALAGVPEKERSAKFVCVMAMVLPEKSLFSVPENHRISEELCKKTGIFSNKAAAVRGECKGTILEKETGDGGFGYDSLFYCEEYKGSFAQISSEEKNRISHRGAAVRKFAVLLNDILQ